MTSCKCDKKKYIFEPSNSGIFVEIYLPKKAEFQGILFKTLTEGFELRNIKNHFLTKEKQSHIKEFMEKYEDIKNYNDDFIEKFPDIFQGYSMYEVDGVFSGEKNKIYEERTQVVRIFFKINIENFISINNLNEKVVNMIVREYLNLPSIKKSEYKEKIYQDTIGNKEIFDQLLNWIDNWIDYAGLFVFGYLVFNICERMCKLCEEKKDEVNHCECKSCEEKKDEAEEEIWVSSFWNLKINRVVHKELEE